MPLFPDGKKSHRELSAYGRLLVGITLGKTLQSPVKFNMCDFFIASSQTWKLTIFKMKYIWSFKMKLIF